MFTFIMGCRNKFGMTGLVVVHAGPLAEDPALTMQQLCKVLPCIRTQGLSQRARCRQKNNLTIYTFSVRAGPLAEDPAFTMYTYTMLY